MSRNRRSQLNQQQVIQLAFALQCFKDEKNEPFDTWAKAIDHFSSSLDFTPTKDNIQTVCKGVKLDVSRVVRDTFNPYGGQVSACFKRLNLLESVVAELSAKVQKIERDIN